METDKIKEAFLKVKEDISFLNNEITNLKYELDEIKSLLYSLYEEYLQPTDRQTNQQINPTHPNNPTDIPTVPQEVKGLKTPKIDFSTGNEGVPTDRQTNQQTDRQTQNTGENIESNLLKAQEILNSLDKLKREIRLKFKKLTSQEMAVFSSIYQSEEQDPQNTTYRKIANNLRLSESSIRDYVQKMIYKGIPIKKEKINNKKVLLSISSELKRIATLSIIIQLREL